MFTYGLSCPYLPIFVFSTQQVFNKCNGATKICVQGLTVTTTVTTAWRQLQPQGLTLSWGCAAWGSEVWWASELPSWNTQAGKTGSTIFSYLAVVEHLLCAGAEG